jgi:hypothetical protein
MAEKPLDIWAEPDVCGWPDDPVPRMDPVKHRAWCEAVAARMRRNDEEAEVHGRARLGSVGDDEG